MIDKETKNKIQKCMDTCFNLITHLPPTPLNYKKEKILRLEDLIRLENTKLSYKLQHSLLPQKLHSMILSDSKTNTSYPQPRLKNIILVSYLRVSKIMKIYP